jgi:hypothetical protein
MTALRTILICCLHSSALLFAEHGNAELEAINGHFKPASQDQDLYAHRSRRIVITCDLKGQQQLLSEHFLGINTSYFNDTDQIWETHKITETLKLAGVGAMRFPGGEETSFYHWQHPGVNGYEDVHADPNQHGNQQGKPPLRGAFQKTWTAPKDWATNEDFMSFDDFMAACTKIGAEPVVGLNLSAGRYLMSRQEGLDEALAWMRYAKDKGYHIKYWFLDNEPWHFEAAYRFKADEYAEDVVFYGEAIKKEFPKVKLIANPTSSETFNYTEGFKSFVAKAGHTIDYLDIHWYWGWGINSFQRWREVTPLTSGDRWKKKEFDRSFKEDYERIRKVCRDAGHPQLGMVCLEWNIAPSPDSVSFSAALNAIIQGELLINFIKSKVHMTCLWPLLWQTRREVWSEQDTFPSIIEQQSPHVPTLALDMFRNMSALQGQRVIAHDCRSERCESLVTQRGRQLTLVVINKDDIRRKLTLSVDGQSWSLLSHSAIETKTQRYHNVDNLNPEGQLFLAPYSLNFLTIQLTSL